MSLAMFAMIQDLKARMEALEKRLVILEGKQPDGIPGSVYVDTIDHREKSKTLGLKKAS